MEREEAIRESQALVERSLIAMLGTNGDDGCPSSDGFARDSSSTERKRRKRATGRPGNAPGSLEPGGLIIERKYWPLLGSLH